MDHDFIKREEINTQNIVMSLRYLEPKRVIEDTRRLRMTFTNFHVSQFDATIGDHFESLLCMQGYLQITSESETQKITKALLSTRIIFPKSYPKKAPTIAIMNPNDEVHTVNYIYVLSHLAEYKKNPMDKKSYLFMTVPRLKAWTPYTDLTNIVIEITKRFTDSFPFIRIQPRPKIVSSPSIYLQKDGMHPIIRDELEKTQLYAVEIESYFSSLCNKRKRLYLERAYHEVLADKLQQTTKSLKTMINEIAIQVEVSTQVDLTPDTIENALKYDYASKTNIQLVSQRDSLEYCLNYLKMQLKAGTSMAILRDNFRQTFEHMFDTQQKINQVLKI